MKTTFALLVILITGTGCATTPIPTNEATPGRILDGRYSQPLQDSGLVIVKRDNGLAGGACSAKVFVDGLAVANLGIAEKALLYLPIGEHVLSTQASGMCWGAISSEVVANVQGNKSIAYRISTDGNGGGFIIQRTAF